MSTPDLGERGHDLNGYSLEDQDFLEKVQDRLNDRPLVDKIRGAAPKILLVFSFGTLTSGFILGNTEIFVGGVCLYVLWQQNNSLQDNPF